MFGSRKHRHTGKVKHETLIVIALLLGWFALQAFVLPTLGIST